MSSRAELAARIERSFSDLSPPMLITVVPGEDDLESRAVARAFGGRHWRHITPGLVQSRPEAIAFLSAEAFRYFLPGYLLLALRNIEALDVSFDSLLSALAGPVHHEDRMSILSPEQLEVTLEVLNALAPPSADDPSYWDYEHAKQGVLEYLTRPE